MCVGLRCLLLTRLRGRRLDILEEAMGAITSMVQRPLHACSAAVLTLLCLQYVSEPSMLDRPVGSVSDRNGNGDGSAGKNLPLF